MSHKASRAETIQGQYYQVGQQFKTHTDYFEPNTAEYIKLAGDMGQRTWTFMIYLNAVELGSETFFPDLGIELTPVIGSSVVWNSILSNGDVNLATEHCARPVQKGEKFVITKWFRTYAKLRENFQLLTG
jgi:prolyl 4-hydroxylase